VIRRLALSGGNGHDARRFRLLYDGFVYGATVERQQQRESSQTRADRREETTIKRALQAISEADGAALDDPSGLGIDRRPRVLKAEGGELRLEQPEFARLQKYVSQTPWLIDLVEHVTALEDWLDAAEKVD
jgi:hypothetical protein